MGLVHREQESHTLSGYDLLPGSPQRKPSEFHMRQGERDADYGYSQHNRGNEVGECQPPTGEDEPEDIAKNAPSGPVPRSCCPIGGA